MIQYNPLCRAGPPRQIDMLDALELKNFAVLRNDQQAIIGFAISDAEVQLPIVGISTDEINQKVWLLPESTAAVYFVPSNELEPDVIAHLRHASQHHLPVGIFSLPTNEPIAETMTP